MGNIAHQHPMSPDRVQGHRILGSIFQIWCCKRARKVEKFSIDSLPKFSVVSVNARKTLTFRVTQRSKFEDTRLCCVFLDPKRTPQGEPGADL
jgi:hypothetical protein